VWESAICLRSEGRRPIRLQPYKAGEDLQNQAPAGWCSLCGREVYDWGKEICTECEKWNVYKRSEQEYIAATLSGLLSGEKSRSL
jgi:hypothetical protein